MNYKLLELPVAELPVGHSVIEDKAARGNERPKSRIEDILAVHEAMKEGSRWIKHAIVVKQQGMKNILRQGIPVPEIDREITQSFLY